MRDVILLEPVEGGIRLQAFFQDPVTLQARVRRLLINGVPGASFHPLWRLWSLQRLDRPAVTWFCGPGSSFRSPALAFFGTLCYNSGSGRIAQLVRARGSHPRGSQVRALFRPPLVCHFRSRAVEPGVFVPRNSPSADRSRAQRSWAPYPVHKSPCRDFRVFRGSAPGLFASSCLRGSVPVPRPMRLGYLPRAQEPLP